MRTARISGAAVLAAAVTAWAYSGPAVGQNNPFSAPQGGNTPGPAAQAGGGEGKESARAGGAPAGKSKLEEMLEQALKANPDIRVAAAKMQEAEAELNRTRLEVTRRVVTLYTGLEAARNTVELAEKRRDHIKQRAAGGAVSPDELQVAETAVMQAKADLAKLDADVPYLLGKQQAVRLVPHQVQVTGVAFSPDGRRVFTEADGTVRIWDLFSGTELVAPTPRPVQGTMAERIRKALDTPVTIELKNKPLAAMLRHFQTQYGLPFVLPNAERLDENLNLQLESQPLGAVLQAATDLSGVQFVVRDYGIFVCPPGQAVPPGAVRLHDFWKTKPAAEGKPEAGPGENPPPKRVEGNVKRKADDSGLLMLNVGSDAGLAKGHTLELVRLNPGRKYLGRLRVVDVSPGESIARPAGALRDEPKLGDVVLSHVRWGEPGLPSGDVEARVKKGETNGWYQLDAGKEAGLQRNCIYELFRGPGQGKYLGRVTVQDINPDGAVIGPATAGLKEGLHEGDRVTLRPYSP
jgi:hypothetical protein